MFIAINEKVYISHDHDRTATVFQMHTNGKQKYNDASDLWDCLRESLISKSPFPDDSCDTISIMATSSMLHTELCVFTSSMVPVY